MPGKPEVVHLRIDPQAIYGLDALAAAWRSNRSAVAARLLDEGIARYLHEVEAVMQSLINRYQEPRATTPTEG